MISILIDEKLLAFITYLGVFLTIYYSIRVRHKKIKYVILRRDKKYVVAYWNACSQTIYKEDIHHLYCLVNVNCKKIADYSTDPDVALPYKLGEDVLDSYRGKRFNRHTRRLDLVVDFINKKSGYLIELDNQQADGYLYANLVLMGRIRGEKQNAVHWATPLDISIIHDPKILFEKALSVLGIIFSILSVIAVVYKGTGWLTNNLSQNFFITIVFLAIVIIVLFMNLYTIYMNSASGEIKKMIQKYKEEGFHEITMYYY